MQIACKGLRRTRLQANLHPKTSFRSPSQAYTARRRSPPQRLDCTLQSVVQLVTPWVCASCQRSPCKFLFSDKNSKTPDSRFLLDITALWIPVCNRNICNSYASGADLESHHLEADSRHPCMTSSHIGHTKKCSRCEQVSYCCSTCQQCDWFRHKEECKAAACATASSS